MIPEKRVCLRWTAFAFLALFISACAPAPDQTDDAVEKAELAALQDAWVAAEIAGDADALRAMTDERMLTTFASGETIDREGYIDFIVNADIKPFTIEFETVELHGDVAVMVSRIVGSRTKISWVAVKKNGRWLGVEQTFARVESADAAIAEETSAASSPVVTSFDALPREQLSPQIVRQALHGDRSTFSRWTLSAGSGVPAHAHANEQVTVLLSGRAVATSGETTYELGPGDVLLFPPNVEHAFAFTEDSVALDFFAPRREDWIDAAKAAAQP